MQNCIKTDFLCVCGGRGGGIMIIGLTVFRFFTVTVLFFILFDLIVSLLHTAG